MVQIHRFPIRPQRSSARLHKFQVRPSGNWVYPVGVNQIVPLVNAVAVEIDWIIGPKSPVLLETLRNISLGRYPIWGVLC